jgi:hypothetical protein
MSNKAKRGRPPKKGGQQPGRPIRIRFPLAGAADKAATAKAETTGELVNRYVREGLERDGFWPPK